MQKELRRNNTIGSTNGIEFFSRIILKDTMIEIVSAREICSFRKDMHINLNAALALFQYLEFIEILENKTIAPTENGRKLYSAINLGNYQKVICDICITKMISNSVVNINAIRYSASKDNYYIKRYGFPLSASIFRNILIQFKVLDENEYGDLVICSEYEGIFSEAQIAVQKKKSLDDLKKQLDNQRIQGEIAELFVLEYERKRLYNHTLSKQIKKISDIDVMAGYDIISFHNNMSEKLDRYIEVKSFKGNLHFYWSRNELDKATLYAENYLLYIIDIAKIDNPEYKPVIIPNPANVIINSEDWIVKPNSYFVLSSNYNFDESAGDFPK